MQDTRTLCCLLSTTPSERVITTHYGGLKHDQGLLRIPCMWFLSSRWVHLDKDQCWHKFDALLVFVGLYTILCGAAFYLLLYVLYIHLINNIIYLTEKTQRHAFRRKPRERRITRTNIFMIAVTSIMYLAATAHLLLSFYSNFVAIFNQDGAEGDGLDTALNRFQDPKAYSQIALEMVNVSFSTIVRHCQWS